MVGAIIFFCLVIVAVITGLSVWAIKKGYSKNWDSEEDDFDKF